MEGRDDPVEEDEDVEEGAEHEEAQAQPSGSIPFVDEEEAEGDGQDVEHLERFRVLQDPLRAVNEVINAHTPKTVARERWTSQPRFTSHNAAAPAARHPTSVAM